MLAWIGLAGLIYWTIESNIKNDQKICSDCSGYSALTFVCNINTTNVNCMRAGCYDDCIVYPLTGPNVCMPYLCEYDGEALASILVTFVYGCLLLMIMFSLNRTKKSIEYTPLLDSRV